MSYFHERKAKNCLNCGTTVLGRFCQNCGQENSEPKESFWHLVVHFFNDITHFDGKFFTTLNTLACRPGFLSREYMSGKRVMYLNPIRMYLFTSFIFFLIFFSTSSLRHIEFKEDKAKTEGLEVNLANQKLEKLKALVSAKGEFTEEEFGLFLDSIGKMEAIKSVKDSAVSDSGKVNKPNRNSFNVSFDESGYKTKAEYDSLRKISKVKDGWIERMINTRVIDLEEKYGSDQKEMLSAFLNKLIHSFPQMLFLSLPLVALFLKLLYINRKQFYYVAHAIFSIHFYIFVFIMMLLSIGVVELQEATGWEKLSHLNIIITALIFLYLYKGMRNFYQQKRGITVLKYVLFLIAFFWLIVIIFSGFALFSIFQI